MMAPFRKHLKGPNRQFQNGHTRKKAFRSNRLTEPETPVVDVQAESNTEEDQNDSINDSEESTEDDPIPVNSVLPYNVLLQSLNTRSNSDRPRRKRRKIEPVQAFPPETSSHTQDNASVEEDQDEPIDDQVIQEEQPEDVSDADEDGADTIQQHLDIDEQALDQLIKETKSGEISMTKANFCDGYKAVVSGPIMSSSRRSKRQFNSNHGLADYNIKDRIRRQAEKLFPNGMTDLTASLSHTIFNQQDVLFSGRALLNAADIKRAVCVHVLDYTLKNRDHILKNTSRIAKVEEGDAPEYRDQGFTRPKILFLLPTRQACYDMVSEIVTLFEPEQTENRKRFDGSFSRNEDGISEDKPDDFRDLFRGNDDDLFRIGIKLTRKTLKYFSPFYTSDMIFASPLGLRMAFTKKGSTKEDYDFLSSIEVVVVDQADALLQQNWEHVEYIFNHLNLRPKEDHGCDFSRVRHWYLDGHAKYLRQTIVLSSLLTPELNQLWSQHMLNIEGKLKITQEFFDGAIVNFDIAIKQTFARFDTLTPTQEPDARFKAFTTTMIPSLTKMIKPGVQGPYGILIYIHSYMDFVRVRNFMANSSTAQEISFGAISEYTSSTEVARARSHFVNGRHAVLLYSGRAHHYRRYKLKGVKRVIMYSLPDNPLFYTEVAGGYLARSISEGHVAPEDTNVRSLFCKWDILKLERVVGTKRVASMLREKGNDVFDFI